MMWWAIGPADIARLPRHRMPLNSRKEGPESVLMTWRAMGLAGIARLVMECQSTQIKGFRMRVDDVAGKGLA